MALSKSFDVWSVQLTLVGGTRLLTSPLHPEIAWIDSPSGAFGSALNVATERRWSANGLLMPWLEVTAPLFLEQRRLHVEMTPPKDSTMPSPLTVAFGVVTGKGDAQLVGFVPALGVGAAASDPEELDERLVAAVKLEFLRSKRLDNARRVLEVQWYTGLQLERAEVSATFHTFSELREIGEGKRASVLEEVGRRVPRAGRRLVFEVQGYVTKLKRALGNPGGRNVLLVGPSGVGKSAIVREFVRSTPAKALTDPPGGVAAPVWETSASTMERTLTSGMGWQEGLANLCTELVERGDWLWIRNLAELFEVGRYVGNTVSMAEYLRPRLAEGQIGLITECTPEELARIEAAYPGYLDSFRRIVVEEPPVETLRQLCLARAKVEAAGRDVELEAVDEVIRLFKRFSPYSGFPAKPVRFLQGMAHAGSTMDRRAVSDEFCRHSGMPPALVDPSHPFPAARLERFFKERIYGQPEAVGAVVEALVAIRAGLSRPKRPIATLLFVGPTGVGKTETAKALATFMFGDAGRMARFDMSEYATPASAIRLADGPAGRGRLTAAARRQPFSVVLLDEIEKADPMVFDLLLQVLGEGRLSDGHGRVADFCSSIIVMTSNIGASDAAARPSGFGRDGDRVSALQDVYRDAAQRHFRPELFNRIDRVVAFVPLDEPSVGKVLQREIKELEVRPGVLARRANIEITDGARAHLAAVGYSPAHGARELQRALRHRVNAPLARALNAEPTPHPVEITVSEGLECALDVLRPGKREQSDADRFKLLADAIDAHRRMAQRVADGSRSAQLRSEISSLRRRKRRLGEAFWRDGRSAARLGALEQLLQRCTDMFATIADLSTEALLSELEGELEPELYLDAMTNFQQTAVATRYAMYASLTDEARVVTMGIYGDLDCCEELVAAYLLFVERHELQAAEVLELWVVDTDQRKDRVALSVGSKAPWQRAVKAGLELTITGPGVATLMQEEAGIHAWSHPTPERRVLVHPVGIDAATFAKSGRPSDVHRRTSVEGRPRRRISETHVVDEEESREGSAGTLAELLPAWCAERYQTQIIVDLTN